MSPGRRACEETAWMSQFSWSSWPREKGGGDLGTVTMAALLAARDG